MRRGRNAGGFTLIEIIVVIAIMGLLAGLVMTRGPTRSKRVELEASARALAGTLRLARGQAIANNKIAVVRATPDGWTSDDGVPRRLPAGEVMNAAVVAFTPEGQSSGGVITIGQGDERIAVVVEWLTGRVAVTRPVAEPAL